jgi:hypothetical protein
MTDDTAATAGLGWAVDGAAGLYGADEQRSNLGSLPIPNPPRVRGVGRRPTVVGRLPMLGCAGSLLGDLRRLLFAEFDLHDNTNTSTL